MNTSTRQLRVLTLGATLAGLALFIGTLTFAAIPGTNGVIHACYDSKQGDVRVVDEAAPCEKDETALSWNQTGPQGPVGAQGPTGATGLQGPIGLQGPAGPAPSKQWMSRWNWTRTLIGVQFSRAETEVFIANPAPVGGGSPSAHVQLDFFVSQTCAGATFSSYAVFVPAGAVSSDLRAIPPSLDAFGSGCLLITSDQTVYVFGDIHRFRDPGQPSDEVVVHLEFFPVAWSAVP